jgi:hypothetical protein
MPKRVLSFPWMAAPMHTPDQERLFINESEFVNWLSKLIEAHPSFKYLAVEPRLISGRGERMAVADLMAVRTDGGTEQTGNPTLVLENELQNFRLSM